MAQKKKPDSAGQATNNRWSFLSNHAHVALVISQDSRVLLREVAQRIGITERAVQRIVLDLEEAGYLTRSRLGRSNCYELLLERPLRHTLCGHVSLKQLCDLFSARSASGRRR